MNQKSNLKNKDEDSNLHSVSINYYPGHMSKTKREITEKIGLIDIVYEVIDARIPLSSKNKEIDNLVKNKPRLLIMNKFDLCDEKITLKWKKYYEDKGYKVVTTDLIHDKKLTGILDITNSIANDLNHKRQSKGLKPRKTRILIVGIPNVGKSTLINRLVGKRAAGVGNKPGITKHLEWIRINNELELLDTPGILWPKLEGENIALNLAAMTAIKEEILNKEEVAVYVIDKLKKYYPSHLLDRYHLKGDEDVLQCFDAIAKMTGSFSNGEINYERVYTLILKDLREGNLGKVTFDIYED